MADVADDGPTPDQDDVMTVAQLNGLIADQIDQNPLFDDRAVIGECTDCRETSAGVHFYLTDGDHRIKCLLWQHRHDRLSVDLDDGMEVIVQGPIDYWPEGGILSLKPRTVTAVGDGDRHVALQQRRQRLADRGWFDDTHKQPLPRWPTRIGVVTSRDGDARSDIEEAIHSRHPDIDLLIQHATVQGERAPEQIAEGLLTLDADHDCDVLVTGRGGGSDDALQTFNSEPVAQAIFHADTPVVTAVGHRDDSTIADDVADHSVITPTAVGPAVAPDRQQVRARLSTLERRLASAAQTHSDDTLTDLKSRLDRATSRHFTAILTDLHQRVESAYEGFEQHHDYERDRTRARLATLETRLETAGQQHRQQTLGALERRLEAAYDDLERERAKEQAIEHATQEATTAEIPVRYKIALAGLVILVCLLAGGLLLTLL